MVERIRERRYWEANRLEEKFEKAYAPREMAVILDIGDSTLRKWCIALEKNGYIFIRNEQNSRIYVERDIVVLRHFQNLLSVYNMNIKDAANLVADRFKDEASESRTGIVPIDSEEEEHRDFLQSNEVLNKLLDHIKQQEEFNQELLKRLDQQQKEITKRDQVIMKLVSDSKLLLDSKNEETDNKLQLDELRHITDKHTMLNEIVLDKLEKQQEYLENHLEQRDKKLMESLRQSQEEKKALLQLAAAQEEKKGFWSSLFKR